MNVAVVVQKVDFVFPLKTQVFGQNIWWNGLPLLLTAFKKNHPNRKITKTAMVLSVIYSESLNWIDFINSHKGFIVGCGGSKAGQSYILGWLDQHWTCQNTYGCHPRLEENAHYSQGRSNTPVNQPVRCSCVNLKCYKKKVNKTKEKYDSDVIVSVLQVVMEQ